MNWWTRELLRRLFMLILLSCCLARAEKNSKTTASLSGIVKSASGATVAVHLESATDNPTRYYDGYEAVPAADGSFSFTEIPAGNYRLSVEANVFAGPLPAIAPSDITTLHPGSELPRERPSSFTIILPANMPSGAVALHAGEKRKNIVIELSHKLSICGHITHDIAPTDTWGRRIGPPNIVPADTSIAYYHFNPEFGVLDGATKFDTDKDGSFHLTDLAPGTYFVQSGQTWYPGTNNFAEAKPVVVGSEPDTTCAVDIQVLPSNVCSATGKSQGWDANIIGRISADPAVDKNRYKVAFLEHNPAGVSAYFFLSHHEMFKPEAIAAGEMFSGNFVCPGQYEVVLYEPQHVGNNLWGDAPAPKIVFDTHQVTVEEHGSAQVVLTPHPMVSIDGDVRLDKVTREEFCPNCQSIHVSILREGNGEFQAAPLSSGNHFNFRNVSPGDYQISISTTKPDKVFLQSIFVNGVAAQGRRLTIPEAKFASIVVTLSGDLAQADGHVSPDVRRTKHWEGEGMRPGASVAGKIQGESNAAYTVRLLPLGYSSSAETTFTARTAENGSFYFEGVTPGIYLLRAHDENYLRFDYGAKAPELRGTPLLIGPGAKIKDLVLNAPRYSSICGHVTDTHGDTHRSLRIWYRSSINQNLYQQIKEVAADNDGYFRIDELLAGDYLLQTSINGRTFSLSRNLMLTDGRPVLVEDGKDTGCKGTPPLEFYVPASDGKTHTVSGSVAGALPARIGDRFLVQLGDAENAAAYDPQQKKELDTDRKFHLDNVPNGRYKLNVYGVYGPEPAENESRFRVYSGPGFNIEPLRHLVVSQLLEVSDRDVTGLTLTQLTLPSVTGTVRILRPPTVWKDFKVSDLSVKLVPHRKNGFLTASLTDKGDGRGEFTMDAADAGEYEVQLVSTNRSRNTNNIYIQSVRLNGEEVNPRFVNLPNDGVAALEIEAASEMASVKAYVLVDKTFSLPVQPLLESCAIPGRNYDVVLFPDPLFSPNVESEPEQGPHYFTAWSSGTTCREISHGATQYWDGGFRDLPPGKYFAIAVEDNRILDLGIFNQGHMSLEQRRLWSELTTIAKPISLHSGENLDLTLEDKTIEAARIATRVGVTDEPEDLHSSNGKTCCHR